MIDIYWKAKSFKYTKKTIDWYWIVWSISLLFIFFIYYLWEDAIFATIIFMLTVIITIASIKRPKINKYFINEEGFFIDRENKKILFKNIKSYNIDSDNLKILINTNNNIKTLLHIPFETTQNISKIDDFLSTKIKKDSRLKIPYLELLIGKIIGF